METEPKITNEALPKKPVAEVTTGGVVGTTGTYVTGGGLGTLCVFIASQINNNPWSNILNYAAPIAAVVSSLLFKQFNKWWTKRRLNQLYKEAKKAVEKARKSKLPAKTLKDLEDKLNLLTSLITSAPVDKAITEAKKYIGSIDQ